MRVAGPYCGGLSKVEGDSRLEPLSRAVPGDLYQAAWFVGPSTQSEASCCLVGVTPYVFAKLIPIEAGPCTPYPPHHRPP